MNTLETSLKQLDLTDTEIAVYSTGLKMPIFSVAELQKKTDLKRPTIYHALHSLQERGLIAKSPSENFLRFVCAPPERLVQMLKQKMVGLEQQAEALSGILPLLKIANDSEGGTLVTHYEGVEGIKTAVDLALYTRQKEWDILAPRRNFFSEFEADFAIYYLQTRQKRKIKARTLWEKDLSGRKLSHEEQQERNPRFLPELMTGKFSSMMILFDDKVLIISSLEKLSAIIIASSELHLFFKMIFEGLWAVSSQYAD